MIRHHAGGDPGGGPQSYELRVPLYSNYGLVNIRDEPYQVLTGKMAHVNARVEELHR